MPRRKDFKTEVHPETQRLLTYFHIEHLALSSAQQEISDPFSELAEFLVETLEGPELTVALRKLLESKAAAVRASF